MIREDFLEGQSCNAYEYLGVHFCSGGAVFRTFAPNAVNIELVLNGRYFQMNRDDKGIWDVFCENVHEGDVYQFAVTMPTCEKYYRSDPFAFHSQVRPSTASLVYNIDRHSWTDGEWMRKRNKNYESPVNIYEVHFGSWQVKYDGTDDGRFYSYDEMAGILIPYVREMGYTHIELLPMTEYPFDGSWGYQVSGYFSATSRYGDPEGLMRFVEACHNSGIGVILDFVPVHFVSDYYALKRYDGGNVFESDNMNDVYSEWGTVLFDYTKPHVLSFMKSAINFWIEKFHIDGLRYDAVAYLIFKNGNPDCAVNDTGIWFLKNTNYAIQKKHPDVMLFAEDSTNYLKVTAPVEFGGLGFDYKWDLGYMNDTINYIKTPPSERPEHHNKMTFSMSYFYNDLFVLPYSHDEVVHGKHTMIDKVFGTREQKMATIKTLYTFQFAHPGKKLNFMGNELGEYMEWRDDKQLGWNLLSYPAHDSLHEYLKRLHFLYLNEPCMYKYDYNASSFRWIDADNRSQSVYAFSRNDLNGHFMYMAFNFSDKLREYDLRVNKNGEYEEVLNSDKDIYGGSDCLNPDLKSTGYKLRIRLAPLSCTIIRPR